VSRTPPRPPSHLAPVLRRARFASLLLASALCAASVTTRAAADDVAVAVAANFAGPMQRIAADFARETGHHAVVSTGATGTFHAQIESGAPFEVLLGADQATTKKLEADGFAVAGSHFTYAIGTLVLWSAKAGYVDAAGAVLRGARFQHLAIANPKLAPYGAAAVQALGALGLFDALGPKVLYGENIAQAYQFVSTGNAELGFVALSQVAVPGAPPIGSYWVVPAKLYTPLFQDAVLLQKGAGHPAARALCDYIKSAKAREVIRAYGYRVP
jgi:molybdate transport system substrate-binding protein